MLQVYTESVGAGLAICWARVPALSLVMCPTSVTMPLRPLRIAMTVYRGNPHSGGQGVYTAFLTRELARLGHEVTVYSGPPYPILDPRVRLVRIPGLDLLGEPDPFRLPRPWELTSVEDVLEVALMLAGGFPDPRSFGWRLATHLAELESYDVVHDNQSLNWAIAELARRRPVLGSFHHPITVDRRLDLEAAGSWLRRLGYRRFYGFVGMQARVARSLARVLTVSEVARRDLAREIGLRLDRLVVVPVGVDTELFCPHPEIAREPGLVVTTASADVPLKGLRFLVEAISLLPGTRLAIIGPHEGSAALTALARRFGVERRVELTGALAREDMVKLYARASVAVVPSLYEGFSLPAVEAMACAVPLVTSRGGALPEVVGQEAATVPAGSARLLAEAIELVLVDYAASLERARAARARAVARFSWRRTALETVAHYQAVLGHEA
jgi:glycosyltransferase involved in cell wall biosynthesis